MSDNALIAIAIAIMTLLTLWWAGWILVGAH